MWLPVAIAVQSRRTRSAAVRTWSRCLASPPFISPVKVLDAQDLELMLIIMMRHDHNRMPSASATSFVPTIDICQARQANLENMSCNTDYFAMPIFCANFKLVFFFKLAQKGSWVMQVTWQGAGQTFRRSQD